MVPKGRSISSQRAHGMLGHVNMDATKATMSHWGWKIKGKTSQCEDCIIGKAKQKSVKKSTNTHATKPGERLFVDISSVNATSAGGRRYWGMVVDDYSRFKWSVFLKNKNELASKVMPIIEMIRGRGYEVEYIRMDNAGENKSLAAKVKSLGITVEYVAPNTP